jgi:2-aminoethylphosphonate-pyruvate transaminase
MINSAIILAAGMGSRIKSISKNKPKSFIEIEGKSLIERSIENLIDSGIKKILIGVGYKKYFFEKLVLKYNCLELFENKDFETTGSFHTLYQFKDQLDYDFLLLESDLLYDKNIISELINDKRKNLIAASNLTKTNDEVFIDSNDNILVSLSKNKSSLKNVDSEFIGINRISIDLFHKMCNEYETLFDNKIDYELLFQKIDMPIYVKNLGEVVWCEIDDLQHLKNAKQNIISKLS